jgi:anti-sigma factor RsiW
MKLEKMSCRRRLGLLLDYLDKELPASQRKLLARHRASCRSCGSLLKTVEHTVRTLKALKKASPPPASARRALAAALRLQ